MIGRALVPLMLLSAVACRPGADRRADSPGAAPAETAAAVVTVAPWAASDSGAGRLRIGMTFAQAASALHAPVPDTSKADSACAYVALDGVPPGMRLMWAGGHLARIEIIDAAIPTVRNARVGDTKARVDSLYRGVVTISPHKYDPRASYLLVRPPEPSDSAFRIVFETDSTQRVARYRVGREPEVEWVEGCA